MKTNKARQVREALRLTPTEAGQVLFGYEPKKAYDMWSRWERSDTLQRPLERYFDLILFLVMCRDLSTPGADQTLDRFLSLSVTDEVTADN